jgi:tetratricopeptide (TPR) repeat protein
MAELLSKKTEKKFDRLNISTLALDNAIYGIIAAIFFLSPIFFTGLVAQGVGFEKMSMFYFLVLLGSVIWVLKGFLKGELDLKRTPLDIPIIATIAIFIVSTVMSISQKDSLIGAYGNPSKSLIAVIVFTLFYYLVSNNIDIKRAKLYFLSFAASIFLLAVYSFLQLQQIFIVPMDFTKNLSFNPVGSLSGLSMALCIAVPLLTVLAAQTRSIFPNLDEKLSIALKVVSLIALLATVIVLVLLNVFTYWLAIILSSVIILIFFMAKILPISSSNLFISLAVFFVAIVFFMFGNSPLIDLNLPTEISLSRSASVDIAIASLKENPLLGSGPSTFYYSFSKFKSPDFNATPLWNVRFDSASGSLFELLSTVGVLGTLGVVVIGLIILSLAFLTLLKTKSKELNPLMLGLLASFITMLLLSALFAQNNSLIIINILVAILTMGTAITIYPEKFQNIHLSFRAAPKYALALSAISLTVFAGVIVLFTVGFKTYVADVHAKAALMTDDNNVKVESLNKAIQLAPYQDKYFLSLANSYIALANQAVVDNKESSEINMKLSSSIENGKKAVELAPNSASNNESLALIYENASFYTRSTLELAEQSYNKLAELEPVNPTPFMRIALVNMARANLQKEEEEKKYYINEALKFYDKTIEKKSDLAAAHYGKAVAYEKLNDVDKSIEEMKQVTLLASSNVDYHFELGRLLFNRGIASAGLGQTATEDIAMKEINTVNDGSPESQAGAVPPGTISVQPAKDSGAKIEQNDDLIAAEQIFLSIYKQNDKHANAIYSLAVLYKKIGKTDQTDLMVKALMNVVDDQATKDALKQQFPDSF